LNGLQAVLLQFQESFMVHIFLHAGAAVLSSLAWVRRALMGWCAGAVALATPLAASAHGVTTGELLIDHPYAVPSAPGDAQGKAYFRAIKNAGTTPERLLGASSPAASRVELHRLTLEAGHAHSTRVESIACHPTA
jgi:copper(I)-binding protein